MNSGGYIPRRKALRYIYLPNQMDKKNVVLISSRNDAPFFYLFAKQLISKDIPSYGSQSKRVKIAIH